MSVRLSGDQALVAADLHARRNVLVSGPAGSGKTTILNHLCSRYPGRVTVTASTGIAALNVRGCTLHSFAGLGRGLGSAEEIAEGILAKRGRVFKGIRATTILAIDEISMISGEIFAKLDRVFQIVRKSPAPFGGCQLLLFGDFLQLPPVSKAPDFASFAFESPSWEMADVQTRVLTKVYRQADQPFVDALGYLRVGHSEDPSYELIQSRNNIDVPDDGLRPIVIHTHNVDVERLNLDELDLIDEDECAIESLDSGLPAVVEQLRKECLAPTTLRLKLGAQVMLLANLDVGEGLVNGSMGLVHSITKDFIGVDFGGGRLFPIMRSVWEIANRGEVLARREQFPLRLAYALTVHKTQGLSLDRIECHLGKEFEHGQAYVAVSRVRTLAGLFLRDTRRHAFHAHPKAVAFYSRWAPLTIDPFGS